jgi:basic membrane protein A and related proteins
MKRQFLLVLLSAVLLIALLSSCAQPAAPAPAETVAATEAPAQASGEKLKAAVLLPGSANDQSWSQIGYDGIQAIGKELGAETAYSENVPVADAMAALRDYASRGFQLVIVHGGQYEEAVLNVADQFPKTQFVVIAGSFGGKPNVTVAGTNSPQIGYTEGWLAGKMTKSNKVGLVSHLEGMPEMIRINGSQRMGAKAANPAVTFCMVYIKNGEDVAEGREAAQSLIDQGADVVFSEANRAWQGVADAALAKGVWTNSRDPSVEEHYKSVLLFSIDYGFNQIYPELARQFKAGTLGGKTVAIGYDTQGGGFTFNYTSNVPKDVLDSIQTNVVDMFKKEPNLTVPKENGDPGCK